jgi:hypothetical protein
VSAEAGGWADVVRDGSWTAFEGLPASLEEAELLAALGREPGPHPRRPALLGSRQRELVELDGLRYWLDGDAVVLVELEDPPADRAPDALVAALGAPERSGAGRYRRFGATTTEHVYPARGLALTVAESYDEPPGFEPFVAAVHLFAASDLRSWVLELGGNDRGGPRF